MQGLPRMSTLISYDTRWLNISQTKGCPKTCCNESSDTITQPRHRYTTSQRERRSNERFKTRWVANIPLVAIALFSCPTGLVCSSG